MTLIDKERVRATLEGEFGRFTHVDARWKRNYKPDDGPLAPCRYVHDGEPGCIAGYAATVLAEATPGDFVEGSPWGGQGYLQGKFTEEANEYLRDLQGWADLGVPWSICLSLVERGVRWYG